MSKFLRLHNTFTRNIEAVQLSGKLISPNSNGQLLDGSFYICGPTVYSESHIGHAITYIRADLFRRFMKSVFNVKLHTVMNITDIDDKILDRTRVEFSTYPDKLSPDPSSHAFNQISERYYKSFLTDMEALRVLPADLYIKVSQHIHLIKYFIGKLERDGFAYISSNGDVHFKVAAVRNYVGRSDSRKENLDNLSKSDKRDFVLWKAAKPGEPVWQYDSSTKDLKIQGRPGWHVQCSAISSALFGNKLDFHFGGKDLIFPHHYNEEACCCAYHNLDTSKSLHVWSSHWLHSGHLILKNTKMSKSLGNVVNINDLLSRSSVNALRLLCILSHYRSDVDFNEELMEKVKAIDHKINAFSSYLNEALRDVERDVQVLSLEDNELPYSEEIESALEKTHQDILDGVCEDFHLSNGLDSIINLSKLIYSKDIRNLQPRTLISAWSLLRDWSDTCGLDYGYTSIAKTLNDDLLKVLMEFRQSVRSKTLDGLKKRNNVDDSTSTFNKLLEECDNIRARLDELGYVFRDKKT